ncbi:MAG: hypothetical protein ACRDSK_09950 [Actinophytocola sp.]|uniref:hypothetical protein n=1 Tax=Actinophytocola sp. TaxID=1872138 RepID=UPI003D6BF1A9
MAGRRPWAVIVVAVLSALVAGGALVAAHQARDRPAATSTPPSASTSPSQVDVDGCVREPCAVLATVPVAGTTVELVADRGARSGRLRIGGPNSSEVIEVTVTDLGVRLTRESLQCVVSALSACVVRGSYEGGTAGQVVAGRSGKWSSLTKPFVSDAGFLALAQVTVDSGPEVVAVQHDCDRAATDCAGTPVFAQVFTMGGAEAGCTRDYSSVEALPGFPAVEIRSDQLSPC